MSLNDGATDDLPQNALFDPNLIEQPGGGVNPDAKPTIVVTDDTNPGNNAPQNEAKDALENALDAGSEITFNVVTDQGKKVVDLREMADEFENRTVITRDDAKLASVSFENLLKADVALNEFSISPSRTNLGYVQSHMKRQVTLEEARLVDLTGQYVTGPLQSLYKQAEAMSTAGVTEAVQLIEAAQKNAADWLVSRDGGVVFVRSGNSMMPLTREPIYDIKQEDLQASKARLEIIAATLASAQHFTNGALRSFMDKMGRDGNPYEILKSFNYGYARTHVTLERLIQMIAAPGIITLPEDIVRLAGEMMVEIAKVTNAYNDASSTYKDVEDFINAHGATITKATQTIHELSEIQTGVMGFALHLIAFLDEVRRIG